MQEDIQRFACTACGACCNRPPELLLSEAAALADTFVFRLMFRLHRLPKPARTENLRAQQRLLESFAVWQKPIKLHRNGQTASFTQYLVVSALPLDLTTGSCPALNRNLCAVYERRPLACRTVPLHYSRAEPFVEAAFAQFIATPGFHCDTSDAAPALLEAGRVIQPDVAAARAKAVATAGTDRAWAKAIAHRLKSGGDDAADLPSLKAIEQNADVGVLSTSMRTAWLIAVDTGLLTQERHQALVTEQLRVIDRELLLARASPGILTILAEMQQEYGHYLKLMDHGHRR